LSLSGTEPPRRPTLYFMGVTTGQSSIMKVFPRWAEALGLDAQISGIDLPLHAPPAVYQGAVDFIRSAEHARGALVTTHKLDLFAACRDQFEYIDPLAELMAEVSCISKRGSELRCHAKDPITGGLAVDAIMPTGQWNATGADAFFIGAGGSTVAITWHLLQASRGTDRPRRILVSNRSQQRLDHVARVHAAFEHHVPVEYHLCPDSLDNDAIVESLAAGSLVVNATGLGKDAPGSPITSAVRFPATAIAWDLNYRGDLVFLDIARCAPRELGVRVEDGWVYFVHGWLQVIGEVFDLEIPSRGPRFQRLSQLAGGPPT
jgi:shikimate 5-dehydrogenase